jgi:hypothetical protein
MTEEIPARAPGLGPAVAAAPVAPSLGGSSSRAKTTKGRHLARIGELVQNKLVSLGQGDELYDCVLAGDDAADFPEHLLNKWMNNG